MYKKIPALEEMKNNWDELAKSDPLWAILPQPGKKDNCWEIEDFFKTGEEEIKSVIEYINLLNIKIGRDKALDFGCGVGRTTQPLVKYFNECYGVDVSPKYLELANRYNKYEGRCKYILNYSDDLNIFSNDTFDFIYSNIVFQHLPPQFTLFYIKELLRIIKPNGLIIFQITTEVISNIDTRFRRLLVSLFPKNLRKFYKKLRYGTWGIKDTYYIKKDIIDNVITTNHGKIIDIVDDSSSLPRYNSLRYCITKQA